METKQTVEIDGKRVQLDYAGAGSESPPTTGSAAIAPGIKFRLVQPDWKHECCWPGNCAHRDWSDPQHCQCHSPMPCDYYVPPQNNALCVKTANNGSSGGEAVR